MTNLDNFDRQLNEHDLPVLFDDQSPAEDNLLKRALSKAERLFGPYIHKLDEGDGGWIAARWNKCDSYGYRLSGPLESEQPRTSLDYERCLAKLENTTHGIIDQNTFFYLFSKRWEHWSIGRGGKGIKNILGRDDLAQEPDKLRKRLNEAIAAISAFNLQTSDCAKFFDEIMNQRGWKLYPDTTVLFHMVWPRFYPIWYKRTEDDYSQIDGIEKLLDALSTELGVPRVAINIHGDYNQYSSAYRLLLRLYHEFVYKNQRQPLNTPHFDYFTQFLAELDPSRETLRMLLQRKALVLYGVPGTGKTHAAINELAPGIAEANHVHKVQFHPGYSYADFIIGIRPRSMGTDVKYPVEPGILYRLAAEAALAFKDAGGEKFFGDGAPLLKHHADGKSEDIRKKLRFVLVIDEINRADMAKVLGEAMFQLEYRGTESTMLPLQMLEGDIVTSVFPGKKPLFPDPFDGGRSFYIPQNLYIIGTMNNADRSISGFDMALRRRFAWAEHIFSPASLREMLKKKCEGNPDSLAELKLTNMEPYITRCQGLNELIAEGGAAEQGGDKLPFHGDHVIGQTYFAEIVSIVRQSEQKKTITRYHLEILWLYYLLPLLEDFLGYEVHQYRQEVKELGRTFISKL
jgi:hypothetical protein